ncbi:MAG: SGNH/GDSL hydrolase family protein [Gammaproteobacteria bacterium]|nr:SGNH/GDSL hydrolase family protein [Gammaproteobacteria bacterium]
MIKRFSSLLVLLFLIFISPITLAKPYNDVYVFGDSLSDTGNVAAYYGVDLPSPPYFQNRVTNGRVAVEALAHKFGLKAAPSLYFLGSEHGTNYAAAGASAIGLGEGDLGGQILAFSTINSEAPSDALYVVFIGGNDVRKARGKLNPLDKDDLVEAHALLEQAAGNIGVAVQSLITAGAKNIIVVNSPNVGAIPETTIAAFLGNLSWLPAVTEGLSIYFNTSLNAAVHQVELMTGVDVMQFDLFSYFNYLLTNADTLGITNTTDPCYKTWGDPFLAVLNPVCVDEEFNPTPNSFFFIDEIHPTKNVHKAIGKAIARQIKSSLK